MYILYISLNVFQIRKIIVVSIFKNINNMLMNTNIKTMFEK